MRRTVTLSGAVFALLCVAMILFALPAIAQYRDDGIPLNTPVTPSAFIGNNTDKPRVFTVESSNCRVPNEDATVTIEDDNGASFKYRNGDEVGITPVGNGQVRLKSLNNNAITNPSNAVSSAGSDFDPTLPITAVGSTGITGCTDDDASQAREGAAQVQYKAKGDVDKAEDVIIGTTSSEKIPNTGGPPLLVFGALLLGVALVIGRGVLRP